MAKSYVLASAYFNIDSYYEFIKKQGRVIKDSHDKSQHPEHTIAIEKDSDFYTILKSPQGDELYISVYKTLKELKKDKPVKLKTPTPYIYDNKLLKLLVRIDIEFSDMPITSPKVTVQEQHCSNKKLEELLETITPKGHSLDEFEIEDC